VSEVLARIAQVREQLAEIERSLREVGGNKSHARLIADLRDRTNDLEAEVYRTIKKMEVVK
jgi:hypothetical protein